MTTTWAFIWNRGTTRLELLENDPWQVHVDGVGLGLFETMRSSNGYIWALEDHLDRLSKSLRVFDWISREDIPPFLSGLRALLEEATSASPQVYLSPHRDAEPDHWSVGVDQQDPIEQPGVIDQPGSIDEHDAIDDRGGSDQLSGADGIQSGHTSIGVNTAEASRHFNHRVRITVTPLAALPVQPVVPPSAAHVRALPAHLLVRLSVSALELQTHPVAVWLSPYIRNPQSPLTGHKSTSFGENILALRRAQNIGCQEALFVDHNGNPVEGATSNLFVIHTGVLITPPIASGCLPGVTRARTIHVARQLGLLVEEQSIRLEELNEIDEIFLTSTTRILQPVNSVLLHDGESQKTLWDAAQVQQNPTELLAKQFAQGITAALREAFLNSEDGTPK